MTWNSENTPIVGACGYVSQTPYVGQRYPGTVTWSESGADPVRAGATVALAGGLGAGLAWVLLRTNKAAMIGAAIGALLPIANGSARFY